MRLLRFTRRKIKSHKEKPSGLLDKSVLEAHTCLLVEHIRGGKVITTRQVLNRCVTDVGAAALCQGVTPKCAYDFNYHESGTGTTAEAVGNTALVTPSGVARVAGTQSNPSSKVYQSIATVTFSSAKAITEHGLFSASTAGTLLDRTVFAAINAVSGDSILFTFQLTMASGG